VDQYQSMRRLRLFFIIWLGMVYLGESFTLLSRAIDIASCSSSNPAQCELHLNVTRMDVPLLLILTILMVLYGTLLWISLSTKNKKNLWVFCLQGGLVIVIYLLIPVAELALSLFLALMLEMIVVFKQVRLAVGMTLVAAYTLLLLLILIQQWITFGANGKYLWLVIVPGIPFYLAQILFLVGYLILYQQVAWSHAQLATAHQELEETHAQLKVSTGRIEELTVLAERQRMARELHDTLAQGLTAVTMLVQGAYSHLTHQHYEQAQAIMQQTMKQAREILAMTRSTIGTLRSSDAQTAQTGYLVSEELARFSLLTDTPCHVEGLGLLAELPGSAQEQVRRFISEGLTNVARHAQARSVRVCAQENGSELVLEIEDDGIGFVAADVAAQTGHYGLLGLGERARLVGGKLDLLSKPGQGTLLRFHIPMGSVEKTHE